MARSRAAVCRRAARSDVACRKKRTRRGARSPPFAPFGAAVSGNLGDPYSERLDGMLAADDGLEEAPVTIREKVETFPRRAPPSSSGCAWLRWLPPALPDLRRAAPPWRSRPRRSAPPPPRRHARA